MKPDCQHKSFVIEKYPIGCGFIAICVDCGLICESNRCGEIYKCSCGNIMDADYNAAMNILHRGQYGVHALQLIL